MLRFYLLGSVRMTSGEEQQLIELPKKTQALLAYLAVEGVAYTREALGGLLWSDYPEERARANLRDTLYRLPEPLKEALDVTPYMVRLRPGAAPWVDCAAFEAAVTQAGQTSEEAEAETAAFERLAEAAELYRGDFLAGFSLPDAPLFDEWAQVQRTQYHQLAVHALERLARGCLEAEDYPRGLEFARQLLAIEPWNESDHRLLMRLLALSGQRSAALKQYEICRQTLADELKVRPDAETEALREAILRGELAPARREPVPAPPPARGTLPAWDSAFIGREHEQQELAALVAEQRLVTITGLGGIGKTRLALTVARAVADRYPHGAYFVPLLPLESVPAVVAEIASQLGLEFQGRAAPREQLLEFLQPRSILLVLDNLEHFLSGEAADEEAESLLELIEKMLQTAPGLYILATSRERLRLAPEQVYPLQGLPVEADDEQQTAGAVALFRQRTQAVSRTSKPFGEQDLARVRRICQALAGLPLAIELAAAQLRLLPLAELSERIGEPALLQASRRGSGARHSSLEVVFEVSWQSLEPLQQRLLAQFSVFRGSFSHQAAAQATGAELADLAGLMDKSFLQRDQVGRFDLHPLVRAFAAEKLNGMSGQEAAARQAHERYYCDLLAEARRAWQEEYNPEVMRALQLDTDNLRTAWQRRLEQSDWRAIDACLGDLWLFFKFLHRMPEAIELLRAALERGYAARPPAPVEFLAHWERLLGESYFWLSVLEKGDEHFRRALALVHRPPPDGQSQQLLGLLKEFAVQVSHRLLPGYFIGRQQGDQEALREVCIACEKLSQRAAIENDSLLSAYHSFQGLNLAEAAGIQPLIARAYATAGYMFALVRLRRLAEAYLRWGVKIARHVASPEVDEWVLFFYGLYLATIGDWEAARAACRQAAHASARLGQYWDEETRILILMFAAYQQGDFERALAHACRIGETAGARGDEGFVAASLYWQGLIRLHQEDLTAVLDRLDESAAAPPEVMNQFDWMVLHAARARAYDRAGAPELAFAEAEKSARIQEAIDVPSHCLTLFAYMGATAVYLSLWEQDTPELDPDEVRAAAQAACQRLEAVAKIFPVVQPRADLYRGTRAWLMGERGKARRAWRDCLARAQALGMPYEAGLAHLALGRISGVEGREHLQRAGEIFAELGAAYECGRVQERIDARL